MGKRDHRRADGSDPCKTFDFHSAVGEEGASGPKMFMSGAHKSCSSLFLHKGEVRRTVIIHAGYGEQGIDRTELLGSPSFFSLASPSIRKHLALAPPELPMR